MKMVYCIFGTIFDGVDLDLDILDYKYCIIMQLHKKWDGDTFSTFSSDTTLIVCTLFSMHSFAKNIPFFCLMKTFFIFPPNIQVVLYIRYGC